jgi:predicted aspartyl protease
MRKKFFLTYSIGILFSVGFLVNGFARAETCKPLTLVTSIDTIPVRNQAAVLVPIKVNGQTQVMLLDTGGVFSEISEKAAKNLKLDMRESPLVLVGISGSKTRLVAHAGSVTLGRLHGSGYDFIVDKTLDGNNAFTGVIAPNLLTNYDVELDFAKNKLNLLSPDHCQGGVIYWPASAAAMIPIRVAKSGHIVVPVELDGVKLDALVDTGASQTVLSEPVATDDLGLKLNTKDTPDIGNLKDKLHSRIYRHRFKQLTIGGIGVSNPSIDIVPDLMNNQFSHAPPIGTRLRVNDEADRLPDLLVGMDILPHLHLYIAYKEEKLYVTPAAPPPTAASQPRPDRAGVTQTH